MSADVRRPEIVVDLAAIRRNVGILRDLVGASGIYLTEHGRAHWDGPARANVDRELARLS